MTPRNRHTRTESVPHSDFGAQEFYDEDDLEELDEQADAGDLAAFDAEAIDEDEEARLLQMRERATKGGQDDPHVASGQRLQKVLAHAGVASRRACEQLIADGRVSVDGISVTEAGVRVDPLTQEIRVDGSRILTNPELITLMLHKPAGVVTTMEDPEGRPTVAQYGRDYLAEHPELPDSLRLVHVGRLDTETEGLLLLSNDGELSHRLMHPSFEIAKTYVAIVEGQVEPWVPRKLRRGIELEDGEAKADRVTVKDSGPRGSIVEITLHSGKNRIVRRMLDAVGHPVTRLARTRLGPLRLGNLRPGQTRPLSGEEIAALQQEVGL
ncbi:MULTISPECIES: pseudouridine synthase [Actinomyces]|uniref:Pseudouridine synthase n=1 Tax=Actinomyces oris TaxID=544580 RepID=A0AAE4G033_9ACTO|nr:MULTISPECIES: pseudouridine synthase [Actinomyces]MDT0248080.1 pseudouridine synthase [Actinomyces oris]OLO79812.1 MFS transporter [Actinomyces oris]QQQ60360.1 rRNA pseudouridine synthase [Actinomyces sp. HMT 175]